MITRLFEHPASLLVLVLLIVVLFAWKQLPDMARSLGRSTRILKSEVDELKSNHHSTRVEPIEDAAPIDAADSLDKVKGDLPHLASGSRALGEKTRALKTGVDEFKSGFSTKE